MATIRQHLINQTTKTISELAGIISNATSHSEDEYSNLQFAEDLEKIADQRLKGWIGTLIETQED